MDGEEAVGILRNVPCVVGLSQVQPHGTTSKIVKKGFTANHSPPDMAQQVGQPRRGRVQTMGL